MTADEDASSPTRELTSSCGQSPLSTFSFDSGSDVSLGEDENQPENQTPHGRLTAYTHGREFTGRASIAFCAGRIPIESNSGAGEGDPVPVSTKGIRRVLHAVNGNSQDDSPAPAMRDSVTMIRRQELPDEGVQLTINPDEL